MCTGPIGGGGYRGWQAVAVVTRRFAFILAAWLLLLAA
jgi:hypothetical protein